MAQFESSQALINILDEYKALKARADKAAKSPPKRKPLSRSPHPLHDWYKKQGITLEELQNG